MAVRLNVNANVTGAAAVSRLNRNVQNLGRGASVAATRLGTLEAAAVRGRASFAALGTALRVGIVGGFAAAAFAANSFIRSTISAGNLVESSRVQFNAFFGDIEVGAQAFDTLNEFAGRVPFTLQEIIRGGTALAAISDGPLELGRNLEIVGNLAAAANLDFATAALQYQRVASAGVAAADLLRDRGVTGLLGFQSGVRVSVEESVRVFEEAFGPGGRFGNVTNNLAQTLAGQTSLVEDAFFRFRAAAAVPLFRGLSAQVRNLVGDFENNDEALRELAETIGTRIAGAFQAVENIIRFLNDNINNITIAFRALVAIQVARFISGIAAAVTTLNVAVALNPIGLLVAAIVGSTAAIVLFREELGRIAGALDRVIRAGNTLNDQANAAESRAGVEADILGTVQQIVERREAEFRAQVQLNAAKRNFQALANQEVNTSTRARQLEVASIGNYRNKVDFQRLVNEGVEAEKNRVEALNRTLLESANARRRSFDNIVNMAELEETNRILMEQQEEWMTIQDLIDDGAANAVDNFFDNVKDGESVFDSLKNTALRAFSDITRAAASRALGDILSGGSANRGTGSGGIQGIFGTVRNIFGFNQGGIVPGGAPYTDRVPALLTPGERVIPRNEVNNSNATTSNITNINISGNVDQRAINMIKGVISTSSAEVGGANKQYTRNSAGLRNRRS